VKTIQQHRRVGETISPRDGRFAFTLMEVLIVIMLMAIVVALVIPSAAPQTEQRLRAAAHLVAAEVELARDLAITYNTKYKLFFDIKANRIVLTHAGENTALDQLPSELVSNTASDPTERVLDLSSAPGLWGQVRIAACASFDPMLKPQDEIIIGPTGTPIDGKSFLIWLRDGEAQWKRYITIVIDQSTGRVSIGSMNGMAPPFGE